MDYSRFLSILVLHFCALGSTFTYAEVSESPSVTEKPSLVESPSLTNSRTLSGSELSGLVVGQTVTLAGRAFYDSFASVWNEQDEGGRFTVAITERPTARLGSEVFVDYGNRRLLQLFLPPNRTLIPAIGADAAAQVYQAILDYQLSQFFGDPDMGRDEL